MAISQLNIENRTYNFYNDLINIKNFNSKEWIKRIYNKKTTVEC